MIVRIVILCPGQHWLPSLATKSKQHTQCEVGRPIEGEIIKQKAIKKYTHMLFITNQEYETALQNGKGNIESKAVVLAQPNRLKLLNKQVNIPRGGIIKLYNVHT